MKYNFRILAMLLCVALLLGACAAPALPAAAPAATAAPETETRQAPAVSEAPAVTAVPEEAGEAKTVVWLDPAIEGNLPENPKPGDDLAAYLCYDWYKNMQIPEGYSSWSSFDTLDEEVRNNMIDTLNAPDDSADQQKAAALFTAVLDTTARDAAGIGRLKTTFDALMGVQSIKALSELFVSDPMLFYFTPLIRIGVGADNKNSSVNVTHLGAPALPLGDAAEYEELTEQGKRMKAANATYDKAILTHNGISETEADAMIAAAFDWETKLAAGIYPVEVSYREDYQELIYNEYAPETLFELIPNFPLKDVLAAVGLGSASRFIVAEPEAIKTLNSIYTEENLPGVKAYLAANLLSSVAGYCDAFAEELSNEWGNTVYGSSGRKPDDVRAYGVCAGLLDELLGKIYAEKYFDAASKEDILEMVQEIFGVYKTRLNAAEWLSEETRRTAIEKLDTMTLRIGYPEVYRFNWDRINVAAGNPLIETAIDISIELTRQNFALVDQPVNKDLWLMSANTVNAYYSPSDNSINFPAAILLPPFYFAEGTRSQNLGGIGCVIAHEITHAFDTTGSQFDKDGNMVNWWTEEDRAAFKMRTDKVAAYYAAIEVLNGEHVRGDLTIGETVADLGAMACTLDIMKTLAEPDHAAFFGAWAGVWAQRITPEYREYLLKYDPHAPGYLRANVTSQQFQEMYDMYAIKEGDFMYVAPEDRLVVW